MKKLSYLSLFSGLLFLIPALCFAQAKVNSIHGPDEILVDLNLALGFYNSKKVVIISAQKDLVVAIGTIRDSEVTGLPGVAKVQIDEIVDHYNIMPGDSVEILNYRLYEDRQIPGFFSLTLNGNEKIPAKYKELAYFGVFTSEGHTLDEKEMLISPFQIQYGVTDVFGVRIVNALWLDGYANAGVKFRVLHNKWAKITINSLGAYKVQSQDWIGQVGGVVSMPKNSKFQNHFMANITFDPQYENSKATQDLRLFSDSDVRSITEYITDRWNRILFGPVYNVELQTLGGTVSHMWIWQTFHMSLGVATRDFSNLTFGEKGYYYVYDLFWRF